MTCTAGGRAASAARTNPFVKAALALQQGTHFRFPEPAMPTGRPYAADPSRSGPPCDGLRVDAEQRGDLSWCQ